MEVVIKNTAYLRRRILTAKATVAVVGQGYVGLTLACAAADAGFTVTGIDVDDSRIDALARGDLSVPGVSERTFREGIATGRIRFTTSADGLDDAEVILICVPTPLRDHAPDLSYVDGACREVAHHL